MRRPKLGSIYHRTKNQPDGNVLVLPTWWVKYYRNGRPFRESSGSEDYAEAERLLKRRQGEIVTGRFAGLEPERVTVGRLLQDLIDDYRLQERGSARMSEQRVRKHLIPAFGAVRAAQLSSTHIKVYKLRRKKDAANATVNRELELLQRALKLGYEREPPLVLRVPKIEMLPEQNVREGILEHESYLKLREVMLSAGYPRYCLLLVVGYHVGTREGELLSIQWPQVDLRANEIRLKAPTTKTKKARVLPVYGEMKSWLEMARAERDQKHPNCRWVFQKNGERMVFNWRTWHNLCALAGVPELLFHDLRRTALTNMIRAGISEKVAMEITGHRTRKTFERYHIVSDRDIREVAVKMANFLPESPSTGTLLGTLTGTPQSKLLN